MDQIRDVLRNRVGTGEPRRVATIRLEREGAGNLNKVSSAQDRRTTNSAAGEYGVRLFVGQINNKITEIEIRKYLISIS